MLWMYVGFIALVLILLALDLGVFHRTAHVVSVREALGWSAFWIGLGLAFAVFIYFGYERHWLGLGLTPDLMTLAPHTVEGVGLVYNDGASATVKYITGYLVEKSLAVVLMVVGAKMMTHVWLKTLVGENFNLYLLAVVLLILAAGASLLASRRERAKKDSVVRPKAA